MAEEEVEEGGKAEGGKKKPILLIVIVLVVLLAAGGGAAAFFMLKKGGDAKETKKTEEKAAETVIKPIEEPFVVNLADTDSSRYLKVKVELEIASEKFAPELEKRLPQISDQIIMLLSSKTYEEISTVAGKQALKQAMLTNINKGLNEDSKVLNVYFSEFVIQ